MTTPQIAQGLAGLGRNGDSMLMHVTPQEVAGLQAIAQANGTSLTTNPDTGMPEAFNLGGFFKSLLPTIAGVGLSAASGGALSPLAIGLITGGATALATGDLKQGIMGGIGGYGGAGLGTSLQSFGSKAVVPAQQAGQAGAVAASGDAAVQNQLSQAALANVNQATASNALGGGPGINLTDFRGGGMFGTTSAGGYSPNILTSQTNFNALSGAQPIATSGAGIQLPMNPTTGVMNQPTLLSGSEGIAQLGSGFKNAITNPSAYVDAAGGLGKAGMQIGMPLGMAALSGLEPPTSGMTQAEFEAERRRKYNQPLNLNQDTGLRLAAGGAIQTGGVMDLYQGTDSQATFGGDQGFGLGRLNNLATQQSVARAEQGNYAAGGVPKLEDGGFVVPADVTFYMGDHNTEKGQQRLAQMYGGQPITGPGSGLSDSIPTSIEGKEPARIANGEVYIPRKTVEAHGGSAKFYKMMDKVRKKATGSTKQAKSA